MNKTDIAMIILISSVGVLVSYFVVSSLPIFKDVGTPVQVKTTDPIVADVVPPDPTVFNKEAINPTVEIFIGGSKTGDPDQPLDETTPNDSGD